MGETNAGCPLPWHDTPLCADETCKGPMVPVREMVNGYGGPRDSRIACTACGMGRVGTVAEVAKAERALRAWALYEAGKVHPDRGCARCNGPLTLDRVRLCEACVEKDNAERQGRLFEFRRATP